MKYKVISTIDLELIIETNKKLTNLILNLVDLNDVEEWTPHEEFKKENNIINLIDDYSVKKQQLYYEMKDIFLTKDIIKIGKEKYDLSNATIERFLVDSIKNGILIKVKRGKYQKIINNK